MLLGARGVFGPVRRTGASGALPLMIDSSTDLLTFAKHSSCGNADQFSSETSLLTDIGKYEWC